MADGLGWCQAVGFERHACQRAWRHRRPINEVKIKPSKHEAAIVVGKPMRSTSAPDARRPSGNPYTASVRTPITRAQNRSPAARSSVADIEIMAML